MHDIVHVFAHFLPVELAAVGGGLVGYWIANLRFDNRHLDQFVEAWNRGHHFGADLEASLWKINGRHDKGYHGLWDRLRAEMERRQHGRILQTMDDYEGELKAHGH